MGSWCLNHHNDNQSMLAMQAQIAALVGVGAGGVEVARPQKREEQVEAAWRSKQGFITTCRLYIRMRMREDPLEIQIQ